MIYLFAAIAAFACVCFGFVVSQNITLRNKVESLEDDLDYTQRLNRCLRRDLEEVDDDNVKLIETLNETRVSLENAHKCLEMVLDKAPEELMRERA